MNNQLILNCPVCQGHLVKETNRLMCENNHSFDIAKEHYVNLYHNKGANAGDDKEMLQARKLIFEKGYYQSVSRQLNEYLYNSIIEHKDSSPSLSIVDAGCGEGYYLDQLYHFLNSQGIHVNYYGFDIAKKAVQLSAKRNQYINWFVANANHIPIQSNSVDFFINMFSYYNASEIKRIMKDDGQALIFRAGKYHLLELKDILYNELTLKESELEIEYEELQCVEKINFNTKVTVNGSDDLLHLLKMTPHYWKTKVENQEQLKTIDSLTITFDIDIYVLKKK